VKEKEARAVKLSISKLQARRGTLITDGYAGNLSFRKQSLQVDSSGTLDLVLAPRGGLVIELQ